MKRGKKIIINLCIVSILLVGVYHLGGFYLSKKDCIEECLRANYHENDKILFETSLGNHIYVMCETQEEDYYSVVNIEKAGFLYKAGRFEGLINTYETYDNDIFDVTQMMGPDDDEYIIWIYRHRPEVEKVEVLLGNGSVHTVEEWSNDFAVCKVKYNIWEDTCDTYRGYDASGNLIGEMKY